VALCKASIIEIQLQRWDVLPIWRELPERGGGLAVLVAWAPQEEEIGVGGSALCARFGRLNRE